ncbi:hypothetical protein EC957_003922 [Mortierella hygrophila]|uniref:Uncharacterized protein n=1 Tax=Mortierella hygrophila TaxID=979708 RepID=A0A9P6F251_9FUNG|nr:hypothetical protein EC957_003922 [Mortierella hygrophila]
MADETRLQSLRQLSTGQVFQFEAYYHSESQQHIILWDDMTHAFPRMTAIRNGTTVVPRARDTTSHYIEPRCIKYYPDKTLDVVESEE